MSWPQEQPVSRSGPASSEIVEFSPTEFRSVCGSFPSGVTIITRRLADGSPYGMTVSSFTSVSLDPPLILVCIDQNAGFLEGLEPPLPFVVNVLSEEQQHLAKRFSKHEEAQRFLNVPWSAGWMDIPILEETSATFYCSVHQVVEGGDHLVLLSHVHGVHKTVRRPLVWCERKYHCLPPAD